MVSHDPRIWERQTAAPAGLEPPPAPPEPGRGVALAALEALVREIVRLREALLTEDEAYRAGYRDGRRDARDFGPTE